MATSAPRKSRVRVVLGGVGLGAYVLLIGSVVFSSIPVDRPVRSTINRLVEIYHSIGMPAWIGYHEIEFVANIALFVPFGFFLALILPARVWWVALLGCFLTSATVEIVQGVFLALRSGSVLDVISNTLGAAIGVGLAVALRALVHARDRRLVARTMYERTGRLS